MFGLFYLYKTNQTKQKQSKMDADHAHCGATPLKYTINSRVDHPAVPSTFMLPPAPYHDHYPVIMVMMGSQVPQLVCKHCGCGFDTPLGIENLGFEQMSVVDLFACVNAFWSKLGGLGRNEKCPCGSNKKYKRCHLLLNLPK